MKQDAAWCLVNVLARRDETDVPLGELPTEVGIVEAVACEPVELVHDDVVDSRVLLLKVAQHLFESGPI
nr:hypothetical protein [Brevibacterium sp.]